MYNITITALYDQLDASRRVGMISGILHVCQWIPLCLGFLEELPLRRIKVGSLMIMLLCVNHKLLTQQPHKPEEVIGQDSSGHHYLSKRALSDVLPEKVINQCV